MDWIRILLRRFASPFRRKQLDAALDEELRAHIDLAIAENRRSGMNVEEASNAALRDFGGITQVRETYRLQRGLPWLETAASDLRYSLRQLRKSPGFTVTALLTLALGTGSVTAVFNVVNTVLMRPYAFRESGRIVVWRETIREIEHTVPSLPDNYRHYLELKTHAHSIQDAAILQPAGFSISAGIEHPHMAEGLAISPNFFSVLGVSPALGRAFTPDEAQAGREKEVILTWSVWQQYFHGDPAALGKTLRVNGEPWIVVGILPKSFRFPVMSLMPGQPTRGSTERYEIFKPLVPSPSELSADDAAFNFLVIGRLNPGVTPRQAQTELDGLLKSAAAARHVPIHLGVLVLPFSQEITGNVSSPLWLLLAAVFSVLLMACVNLASLQTARAVAREHDTALRFALGANRARLLQGLLAENITLGFVGSLGAVAFAFVAEKLLLWNAAALPRLNEVHLDLPILAFAVGLSLATSIGFGLLPALRSMHILPQISLQSASTRLTGSRHALRARTVLVGVQMACSVMLLIVTALIIRSFSHLLSQDRKFSAAQVLMAKADLSSARYGGDKFPATNPGADSASLQRDAMIDRTLDQLRALPGVQHAAVTSLLPLTGDMNTEGLVRPDHPVPEGQIPIANRRIISPGYFYTMGISLLAGRDFTDQDRRNPRVTILSRKAADAAFPGENPIGRTIEHWGRTYSIVGVAADARINDLKRDAAVFYQAYWDYPPEAPVFMVRSSQGIETLGPTMRQTIWSIDPDVAVPTLIPLDMQVAESVATERFQTILLSSFGIAALLLAALGIYGVLAYSVSLRRQEFGIRIALGSTKEAVVVFVFRQIVSPAMFGAGAGLALSFVALRWVRSLLYETPVTDPLAIGGSIALLMVVAIAAATIPARRAASIDPMSTLRCG